MQVTHDKKLLIAIGRSRKAAQWQNKEMLWSEFLDKLANTTRTRETVNDYAAMTKAERLDLRDSAMNHAMVITGVNLDAAGQPNRWKIENSWGDEHGDKGYYLMDGGWFDEYVYQAVINKKHLSEKQLAALETEPLHFFPWDPMGTLAE